VLVHGHSHSSAKEKGMYNATTQQGLDVIIQDHSSLITNDELLGLIGSIPTGLKHTPEAELLAAMEFYNQQHKSDPPQWAKAFENFRDFGNRPLSPVALFYKYNYEALALTKANPRDGAVPEKFLQAFVAVEKAQEDIARQHQLLGFARWNQGRWLLTNNKDYAFVAMMKGICHRVSWYKAVRDINRSEKIVAAAAEQIRKAQEFFAQTFDKIAPGDRSVK
jgi:hypothetical protein